MKLKLIVAALSIALVSSQANAALVSSMPRATHTPVVIWAIFGCTGTLVASAIAANYIHHRQLTGYEAATCGIAYWLVPPKQR